ncbi:helix-turn-helix transcriptional regulator [Dictyobacter alpinus]|uniref:Helix-turn-helix transcriptional regulator n=1 Tax=Dictyobacter alpinus TaxID=2014873 RepID=A0A402BJH6_9CHLR|nr:LuxR C-terminal-related transcriptional regulator [Dictyobacter alpinus]GCE31499.1 helix-turn-helix transcriptional regulator [Dictyobacter alpinus]
MPRRAPYRLLWSEQVKRYELVGAADQAAPDDMVPGEATWFTWLDGVTSFAFHSRSGINCTVRKEVIQGSGSYWYGYRSLQQRTVKRYLGRTRDLSLAHLEKVAESFVAAVKVPTTPGASTKTLIDTNEPVEPPPLVTPLGPLLESKLRPPRLSHTLIERPRLHQRLDAWQAYKLTLLNAPAGFGKTTLTKSWLNQQHSIAETAWVSLDTGDNDPIRFWRYILAACQAWSHPQSQHALALLLSISTPSLQPISLETVLTVFLNQIARQDQQRLLVLEDYHVLTEPRIHESFNFLLAHLPENLHILLITRLEPPLALVRLRANGELNELQTSELRFTYAEMVAFLERTLSFPLSAETLERLHSQLDGWAAGLRLLSLSLQGKQTDEQIEQALASFRGSQPSIRNYFIGEVLQAQTADLQDFLLRTSILTRLSPSLCAAVTNRTDSATLLETIEQANLFLEALDCTGEWYRYHELFAEAMQHEAQRRLGETALKQLYQAASLWFEEHGLLVEAIEAAFHLDQSEQVARLIDRHIEALGSIDTHEHHTLLRWLERLPQEVLRQFPLLCFSYAVTMIFGRDQNTQPEAPPTRFEEFLQLAENGWRASNNLVGLGKILAMRALLSFQLGKRKNARSLAAQALEWLPEDDATWRSMCLMVIGLDAMQMGQFKQADQTLKQVYTQWTITNNTDARDGITVLLGLLSVEQGDLQQASNYYRKLIGQPKRSDQQSAAAAAHLGLTYVYYEWNMLEEAAQQLQEGLRLAEVFTEIPRDLLVTMSDLMQALLQHSRGETQLALQYLTTRLRYKQDDAMSNPFYAYMQHEIISWIVRLSLLIGDQATGEEWINELTNQHNRSISPSIIPLLDAPADAVIVEAPLTDDYQPLQENGPVAIALQEEKALLEARLYLAQGQAETALKLLNALLPAAHEAGRGHHTLQIRLLLAQAYSARKQVCESREVLLAALKQAQTAGYQRLILDEGDQLFLLLRDLLPELPKQSLRSYVQSLLRSFAQQRQKTTVTAVISTIFEPLSKREQKVLRLLIAGHSNPEIARELIVSVNTIRTQIQSIYRKLQVNNRQAASEVARELNLL